MLVVLGGKGYVASAFAAELERSGREHRILSRSFVDYTDRAALRRVLREWKPEFLVNAAGYTGKPNVDACELDQANCLFGNAVFPGYVREVCEDLRLPWAQISSGCIYSGEKEGGAGFTEEDAPNFCFRSGHCSFYSGSKALGEEVLAGANNAYVLRARIPFNHEAHPRNYLQKLLTYDRLLDAKNSISHLGEAVSATLACFDLGVPFGIYNVTNPGVITTRQIVGWMREESERRKIEGIADPFGKEFAFFESDDEFLRTAAKTPRSNCVMDSSKLLATGIELSSVEDAVRGALRMWAESPVTAAAPGAG